MDYTGKQKAQLRALAGKQKVMFQIGQNGVTDNVKKNIIDNLTKHEVGRVSVLKNCPQDLDEVSRILTELGVEVIYTIGKVLILYKENKKIKDRIRL